MTTRRKMARNSFWLTGAFLARNVALILCLAFIARLLDSSALGETTLSLAIATPIFVVAEGGLRAVFLTLRFERPPLPTFLLLRVLSNALATLVSIIITAVFAPSVLPILILITLIKFSDSCSDLASAPLQEQERTPTIFLAYVTGASASAILVFLALITTADLVVALSLLALVSISVAIFFTTYAVRLSSKSTFLGAVQNSKISRRLMLMGAPLGLTSALLALVSTIPQYQLAEQWGATAVGVFSVALYTVVVIELVFGAISQAWLPRAKLMLASGGDFFTPVLHLSFKWLLAMLLAALPILALASAVLQVVFGVQLELMSYIPLYIWALLTPPMFFAEAALNLKNVYRWTLVAGVMAVATTAIAGALLVPTFGITGALFASTAGIGLRSISAFVILRIAPAPVNAGYHSSDFRPNCE
jgi:O-antigen/teichoic acid export membrane protein